MYIGARTHDFGTHSIDDLPVVLKQNNIEAAQLVLPKAFTEIDSYQGITIKQLEHIRRSFENAQIPIHILGCYMDLGNPEKDVRETALKNFEACFRYAGELGAHMVGTETAYPHLSREEKAVWYPYMMDSLKRIVDMAERMDVVLALEPVYWHPLESLAVTKEVFSELKSSRLKMIFDPANVLEVPEQTNQKAYWKQWLLEMGDKIEAIHMKDFTQGEDKSYQPVKLGCGVMEYQEIFHWMSKNKNGIVIIREELQPETAKEDVTYIKQLWKSVKS